MSDTIAASRIRLPRVLRARDPQAVETSQRQAHCSTKTLAPRYRTSDIHRDGTRHITQRTLIAFVRVDLLDEFTICQGLRLLHLSRVARAIPEKTAQQF
jgi:hypothetical protein